jgi:chaperone required for assembly of F1-ATPase
MAGPALAAAAGAVNRFYKAARAVPGGAIVLDDRPVRTPARHPLIVANESLAEAIAAEWNAQGEKIDPRSMPLTGLANAAIDRVDPDREAFANGLAAYAESDQLCYRAEGPQPLVESQQAVWDPIIAWARHRYDVDFELVAGVMHRPQPRATLDRLALAVRARSAFELAALSPLVTIGGSLIVALALAERAIDLEAAWSAVALDDLWQAEKWGADAEAARALDARRRDFAAAYRFLSLL